MVKKYKTLTSILLIVFLDRVSIGFVYPIFSCLFLDSQGPLIGTKISLSERHWFLGLIFALMSLAQFFSAPILGTLSDEKGRKPLFLISLLIACLGHTLSIIGLLIDSLALLIISRVVVGIAAGNISVVTAALADMSTGKTKAKYFGLYGMASGLGYVLGPIFGTWLSSWGLFVPFVFASLAALMNFFIIYKSFKETHLEKNRERIMWFTGVQDVLKAFHFKKLKPLFCAAFCFGFAWAVFYQFISVIWIEKLHYNSLQIGTLYSIGSVFYALGSGLLIRLVANRWPDFWNILYACALSSVVMFFIPFITSMTFVWVYLILLELSMAIFYPTLATAISNSASRGHQGKILGVLQSVQAASLAMSPLFATFLLNDAWYYPMLFAGGVMLIASLVLIVSKKHLLPSVR